MRLEDFSPRVQARIRAKIAAEDQARSVAGGGGRTRASPGRACSSSSVPSPAARPAMAVALGLPEAYDAHISTEPTPPSAYLEEAPIGGRPIIGRFRIEGEPASKARPRFTKAGKVYTPDKTREAEERVAWAFVVAAPTHRAETERAYGVVALFVCCTRQRRDVDNMMKLILDGLTGHAWADDEQVVEIMGRKWFDLTTPDQAYTEVIVYDAGTVERREAKCERCGAMFATYPSWSNAGKRRRFCSQECAYAQMRARQKSCEECGGLFTGKATRFCSLACRDAAQRATVVCTGCGQLFTKQRCAVRARNFCAASCRDAFLRTPEQRSLRRARAEGVCEACGGPTTKKSYRRCRPCVVADRPPKGRPSAEVAEEQECDEYVEDDEVDDDPGGEVGGRDVGEHAREDARKGRRGTPGIIRP